MRRALAGKMLVAVACALLGSLASADDTKKPGAAETAGAKVDEAAGKTADESKVVGRKVKRTTKRVVKKTGAAVDRAGDKIEDVAN